MRSCEMMNGVKKAAECFEEVVTILPADCPERGMAIYALN